MSSSSSVFFFVTNETNVGVINYTNVNFGGGQPSKQNSVKGGVGDMNLKVDQIDQTYYDPQHFQMDRINPDIFQAVRQNEVVGKDANSEQNWTSRCTSEVAQQQYDAQLDLAAGETIKMKLKGNKKRNKRVDKQQIQKVKEAEAVVAYIVKKLDEINAPVSLAFGTLLHEYRNNTDANPCVKYEIADNDLDMALLESHFRTVAAMRHEIEAVFDWKMVLFNPKKMVIIFVPQDRNRGRGGYQLDVYGFKTNYPRAGLAYFPWDNVT